MFNLNLTTVINWLLPTFMRGTTLRALLKALVTSVQNLHDSLDAFRTRKQYELAINGQVIWLEKMLNGIFDPVDEGIYIEDLGNTRDVFLFNANEENDAVYVFNNDESIDPEQETVIYNDDEIYSWFKFKVKVPSGIYADLLLNNSSGLKMMESNLNKYKVFGTNYEIVSL
ncbi:MAG: hypothetical protein ACOYMF_17985 [Bacteroidales bacterium]